MKKLTSILLASALALSLAACSGNTSSDSSSSAADTSSSSEAAVDEATSESAATAGELTTVEEGMLIMSTNAAFPPYEMTNDAGEFEGIDVEIAQAIADKLGL